MRDINTALERAKLALTQTEYSEWVLVKTENAGTNMGVTPELALVCAMLEVHPRTLLDAGILKELKP